MNEVTPADLQALWQGQRVEPNLFSPDELRSKAGSLQRLVRRRNLQESLAAVAVAIVFAGYAVVGRSWLFRAGAALTVAAAIYVLVQLQRRAAAEPLPVPGVAAECLAFHRRGLERQRDALRTVWSWYLAPLLPGFVLIYLDRVLQAWAAGGQRLAYLGATAVLVALAFAGVAALNATAARRLQQELDALPESQPGAQS